MMSIRVLSRGLPRLRVFALIAVLLGSPCAAAADEPLVVHEWGVMIREGGDLLAPPVELFDAVPKFVLRHHAHFKPKVTITGGLRSWNKPVLHFYGKPGTKVTVRVMTPKGRPLMYWPQPKLLTKTVPWDAKKGSVAPGLVVGLRGMKFGMTQATGMEWTGTLSDHPPASLSLVRRHLGDTFGPFH